MNIREYYVKHAVPSRRTQIIGSIKLINLSSKDVVIASTSRNHSPQQPRPTPPPRNSSNLRQIFRERIREQIDLTRN